MENRKVALYIRLSHENTKSGSASIETQEQILMEKLSKLPEYQGCEVVKLIDNGYSGTSFDRPALNELLDKVKLGEICCTLIKDFSRLGRDIAKSGKLIDNFFPIYYTRLISVSDFYDSNDYYEDTGGIDIAFKCMLAEQYSFDLSKKVKATLHSKMKKGEYRSKRTFYGMKLNDKREYVIDEVATENIRLIFRLASEGNIIREIRDTLHRMKIPTAGEYAKANNHCVVCDTSKTNGIWSFTAVRTLLRDERYIGTYLGGMWELKGVGSGKRVKKPESEWIKIPNLLPAIIEKDVFDKVQELFPKKNVPKKQKRSYPLRGTVTCGVCQHKMSNIQNKIPRFYCSLSGISGNDCGLMRFDESSLYEAVFNLLQTRAEGILEKEETKSKESHAPEVGGSNALEQIQKDKMVLYERLTRKEIDTARYREEKVKLDSLMEHHTIIHRTSEQVRTDAEQKKDEFDHDLVLAKEIMDLDSLTVEISEKLIKNVTCYPDKTVEIVFTSEKFSKPQKIVLM